MRLKIFLFLTILIQNLTASELPPTLNLGNLTPQAIWHILNKITIDKNKKPEITLKELAQMRNTLLRSIKLKYTPTDWDRLRDGVDEYMSGLVLTNYDQQTLNKTLLYFVRDGNLIAANFLLKAGADPNTTDNNMTALALAIHKGYTDIANLLIEAGALA